MNEVSELREFHRFLSAKLENGSAHLLPEEVVEEWRQLHPEPWDNKDDVAAIQAAIDDVEKGEKGMPFDPVRMKLLAETVSGQIYRGSDILRNLNRLAHSTDEPFRMTDVGESVSLMTGLCGRFALMRNVSIDLKSPEQAIVINTHTFLLETMIYRCLKFAIDGLSKGNRIEVRTEKKDQGAQIHFLTSEPPGGTFPTAEENELSEMLNAKLSFSATEIILEIA